MRHERMRNIWLRSKPKTRLGKKSIHRTFDSPQTEQHRTPQNRLERYFFFLLSCHLFFDFFFLLRITTYLGDGSVEFTKQKPFYLTLPEAAPAETEIETVKRFKRLHAQDPLADINAALGRETAPQPLPSPRQISFQSPTAVTTAALPAPDSPNSSDSDSSSKKKRSKHKESKRQRKQQEREEQARKEEARKKLREERLKREAAERMKVTALFSGTKSAPAFEEQLKSHEYSGIDSYAHFTGGVVKQPRRHHS
eukprot:c2883_g1_i1.p1 GENE.c2883_g1_i1~~c2883_g1_i1.p1  ORF type:complete len:253 (+),score=49.14 c2883_g1_i1:328-1086(+)